MANAWTRWPLREALSRHGLTPARRVLARSTRFAGFGVLMWTAVAHRDLDGWESALVLVGVGGLGTAFWGMYRTTLRHLLWPSLALFAVVIGAGFGAEQAGFRGPSLVIWCGCVIAGMVRLPLFVAAPVVAVALAGYVTFSADAWPAGASTAGGLVLAGYVLRLDAEARETPLRLLAQERAARKAEAESAALAERARIAREIHDVLAHSLSAQLVHLEAARLLVERGADREQIRDQIVGARRMAQDGLAETRQALSALRGEIPMLEDYLRDLVSVTGAAEVTVTGDRRALPAEASQAVRRVAQEALTNVRKHARGAEVLVHLVYGEEDVTLSVQDSGGTPGEFADSGGGYGLRGMRERAELLGGTLAAGPHEEGFAVMLKVPA